MIHDAFVPQDYPLIFTVTNEIRCQDSSVRVVTKGRVLMVFEEGEWWCHGVEPGGMTEHGQNPGEAYAAFKSAYRHILQDLAKESRSVRAFEATVRGFVTGVDNQELERWEQARVQIREGRDVEGPFSGLRRDVTEVRPSVEVQELKDLEADESDLALAKVA